MNTPHYNCWQCGEAIPVFIDEKFVDGVDGETTVQQYAITSCQQCFAN